MSRAPQSSEQLLTHPDALDQLGDAWRELWARTRPVPPMLELNWVRTWWRLHRDQGRLFVLLLRDEQQRPLALAPLYIREEGFRDPRRCLRNVCFLGTGEREEDELTGEYNTWLGAPEVMAHMTARVAAHLQQAARQWDRLKLDRLCPEPGIAAGLTAALRSVTLQGEVISVATFRSPTLPLDKYIQAVPSSNFRHRCRRAMRAAKEEGLEFVRARDPQQIAEMFAALRDLHQARWKERGERGVFASPLFTQFHQEIRDIYHREGRMWLVGLRRPAAAAAAAAAGAAAGGAAVSGGGSPWVAVRYLLRAEDRLYDYVSGVDTGTNTALAPGLVLHLHTIDACAAEGIAVYDLMAGDYDYKRKLTLEESVLETLDLRGRTVRSRLWLAARDLARKLRPPRAATAPAAPAADGAAPPDATAAAPASQTPGASAKGSAAPAGQVQPTEGAS
jgi:CelD/BcsL family acetyltransferase involved in cellulose biosynthesis